MICEYCGYEFRGELGRYGCPNCLAEGLEDNMTTYTATYGTKTYTFTAESHADARRKAIAFFTTTSRPNAFAISVKQVDA